MSAECARYGCLAVGAHTRCATDLQNIGKVLRVHQSLQVQAAAHPLDLFSAISAGRLQDSVLKCWRR